MRAGDILRVSVDANGKYISASVHSKTITKTSDSRQIQSFLEQFSNLYGYSIDALKDNQCPFVKFQRLSYSLLLKKNYKPPLSGRRLKRRIISLATAGMIAFFGMNSAYNYHLKRESVYNNKYVYLYRGAAFNGNRIEGVMYEFLEDYDCFHSDMCLLVNSDWQYLSQEKINDVFSKLDLILHSNDSQFKCFESNNGSDIKSLYTFSAYKYFKSNDDAFVLKELGFCYNDILLEIQNNSRDNAILAIRKYAKRVGELLFDELYYNENRKEKKTHLLSPLTRYIIFTQARSIFSMNIFDENESLYRDFTRNDFLKIIDNKTSFCKAQIMERYARNQDTGTKKR